MTDFVKKKLGKESCEPNSSRAEIQQMSIVRRKDYHQSKESEEEM